MASGIAGTPQLKMDVQQLVQQPELNTEDVQLPPIFEMSNPVLKRVLQYVYGSSRGSAALQCRLVCRSFNDLMLKNVRLHLDYRVTAELTVEPNRCQLSLNTKDWSRTRLCIPTDQLINSSLIDRIVTMEVFYRSSEFFDELDLVRLASKLSGPVDLCLSSGASLPILPLAEMAQIRVVEVDKLPSRLHLTPPELNFMANLPHLNRLSMSRRDLLQLAERVDLHNICELYIKWQSCKLQDLVDFNDNFINLQTLSISIKSNDTDNFSFRGVSLPHLVKFVLSATSDGQSYELDSTKRLLTSMSVAMPNLKELRYSTGHQGSPELQLGLEEVDQLISVIFSFCPTTVEDFSLNIFPNRGILPIRPNFQPIIDRITQSQREQILTTLFTSVLDSKITRVSFGSYVNPAGYGMNANRSGVQVGLPVKTKKFDAPVYQYQLKRRNGQICSLQIIYNRST